MPITGLDPVSVRAATDALRTSAEQLENRMRVLTDALSDLPWYGPDSEDFRARWQSGPADRAAEICRLLRELTEQGGAEITEQENASAA